MPSSIDDSVPIANALFARVLRADPDDAAELTASLPEQDRARLALFCNARAHLREIGLAVAAGCSDAVMRLEGGYAGQVLAEQARGRGPSVFKKRRDTQNIGVSSRL